MQVAVNVWCVYPFPHVDSFDGQPIKWVFVYKNKEFRMIKPWNMRHVRWRR
jgi:hypothetical protein